MVSAPFVGLILALFHGEPAVQSAAQPGAAASDPSQATAPGKLAISTPISWRNRESLGEQAIDRGQYDIAIRHYRDLLSAIDAGQAPALRNLPVALRKLAQLYQQTGDTESELAIRLRLDAVARENRDITELRENGSALAALYWSTGKNQEAIEKLDSTLSIRGRSPMHPLRKTEALMRLAEMYQAVQNETEAKATWQRARNSAKSATRLGRDMLTPIERLQSLRCLGRCHLQLGELADSLTQLRASLSQAKNLARPDMERAVLVELAELYLAAQQPKDARPLLEKAIGIRTLDVVGDQVAMAQMNQRLSEVCQSTGDEEAATNYRDQAARINTEILRTAQQVRLPPEVSQRAFEQLLVHHQKSGDVQKSLETVQLRINLEPPGSAVARELELSLAVLWARVGNPTAAHNLLVSLLRLTDEKTQPARRVEVLQNLAAVEQTLGEFASAEEHARQALKICETRSGEISPLQQAEAFNNAAYVLAGKGEYRSAIGLYERALSQAKSAGDEGEVLTRTVHQNMSRAYQAQGQFDAAEEHLEAALALAKEGKGTDREPVSVLNALAELRLAQGDVKGGWEAASRALALLRSQNRLEDLATADTYQSLADIARLGNRTDWAERFLQSALSIQEKHQADMAAVHTYNQLAQLALLRRDYLNAERASRKALGRLEEHSALPVAAFLAHANLAEALYGLGETSAARAELQQAIALAESPRTAVVGADQGRARFFSQFGSAFDTLVSWNIEQGDLEAALVAAERGRNRTFLDQLEMVGFDPRASLRGTPEEKLLEQEAKLLSETSTMRHKLDALPTQAPDRVELQKDLAAKEKKFGELHGKILDANPAISKLLSASPGTADLSAIRKMLVARDDLMLVYHFGRQKSYVLLLGKSPSDDRVFPLTISDQQSTALAAMPQIPESDALVQVVSRRPTTVVESSSGVDLDQQKEQTKKLVEEGSLTRRAGQQLVGAYVRSLRQVPKSRETTDTQLASRAPVAITPSKQGVQLTDSWAVALTDVILPKELRQAIQEAKPRHVIVVPDGPLHELPFEALVLEEGSDPVYVLDSFPPIAYAPSATVLAKLAQRPSSINEGNLKILSVANPEYGGDGSIASLPGSSRESMQVKAAFPEGTVEQLDGEGATESTVVAKAPQAQILHLATHGMVENRLDNLFGSILLTPGAASSDASPASSDDGRLSLHEILAMPLQNCELAVLSACETNIGPQRPREAASSLSRAFLAAGAHRTVASLWSVADCSTAELMGAYFADIAAQNQAGKSIDYSASLQRAQQKVRRDSRWRAPYYWAPFVLVGPAESSSPE